MFRKYKKEKAGLFVGFYKNKGEKRCGPDGA